MSKYRTVTIVAILFATTLLSLVESTSETNSKNMETAAGKVIVKLDRDSVEKHLNKISVEPDTKDHFSGYLIPQIWPLKCLRNNVACDSRTPCCNVCHANTKLCGDYVV